MTTITEIQQALSGLSHNEKQAVYLFLERQLRTDDKAGLAPRRHSVLDIPTVRLGPVLRPFDDDLDLLDEMLEGRP